VAPVIVIFSRDRVDRGGRHGCGDTDRAVEPHQLALELEEGSIVAGRVVFRHWVSSNRARVHDY
jgi:hypothetical protein